VKIVSSENAWEDYLYWQKSEKKILVRINSLIKEIRRTPFQGMGKPEPLKHALSGYWSRRINAEHRIVYKVADDSIYIAQLRLIQEYPTLPRQP
jgi:toxin YoeB